MGTTLPVSYSHTVEGFTKGIDQNSGPFYRVQYKIDNWSDADAFVNAIMGFGTATGTPPTVTRGTPHQYPQSPNLWARSAVVVAGLGNPVLNVDGHPDFEGGALIEVEYRPGNTDYGPVNYNITNNQIDPATPVTWATQEIDFATETYTLGKKLTYDSGPNSGAQTSVYATFQIPITIMVFTFHKLPYLPMTAVRNLRGRVNSTTFLGSAAGLVLFKGGRSSREFNSDGTIAQRVVLTFEERDASAPWNSLPSENDPTFYPVSGAGGVKMYKLADLTPLVQF